MGYKILHTVDNLPQHLDGVVNAINDLCSDIGLCREFKSASDKIYRESLKSRPIGLLRKDYSYMRSTLNRNIGSGLHSFDGYATPIGSLANFDYNSEFSPSYMMDGERKHYENYLRYVDRVYFNGYMQPSNFISPEHKARHFDYTSLLLEANAVGVIRNYNIDDNMLAKTMFANGVQSNPNSYSDTRLGIINNFYLNATLQNARFFNSWKHGAALTPSVYDQFGFFGKKGMINGEHTLREGMVSLQDELTDTIQISPLNIQFGASDSPLMTDFVGLSGNLTQQFIFKSLFGVNLLSPIEVDYDSVELLSTTKKRYIPRYDKTYLNYRYGEEGDEHYFADVSFVNDVNGTPIRYEITNVGNGHSINSRQLYVYAEAEWNAKNTPYKQITSKNSGVEYNDFKVYDDYIKKNDIIAYTNECFINNKYKTLIGRFHTSTDEATSRDMLSSAVSQYGMSHGRNLLKKNHKGENTNGYSDPYCRVWTFHKQYQSLQDTIRPLIDDKLEPQDLSRTVVGKYQPNRSRLQDKGVKGKNGLVRFSPIKEEGVSGIKRCMFSIENLAWKRESIDKSDQKGPFGGRIMWFPPYGLSFNESVGVNWNSTNFIGRGESIYTYTNTERSGTLSFKLLIDHPSLLNEWRGQHGATDSVDDVESAEQAVLRFFAGCEVLEPTSTISAPQTKATPSVPLQVQSQPQIVESEEVVSANIKFYVFFPNNYSGKDDSALGLVKPMEYIMYGGGCQKTNNLDVGTMIGDEYGGYERSKNGISTYIDEKKLTSYTCKNRNGNINTWKYRVDKALQDEVFRSANSYIDDESFCLNSSGYTKLTKYHTEETDNGNLYSFEDVFCALEDVQELSSTNNKDKVSILKTLLKDFKVKNVEVQGCASGHGYDTKNDMLSRYRAESIIAWLCKCNKTQFDNKCQIIDTKVGPSLTYKDARAIEAKVWRCASVNIFLEKTTITHIQNTTTSDEIIRVVDNGMQNIDITNPQITARQNATIQAQRDLENGAQSVDVDTRNSNIGRYGNEHEFFEGLKVNEPFLHNRIVDKIKYFDPAYHSITPEGFNARLTFLHQCTRQGSTTSASSTKSSRTASNLSFGAPPICVLRIGDFFHTKIIIDSLNISYDDMTWDLNDEGIGVMPMIADINIGFKFLGGSDLSGPITRLQNAVSFNYYANTSVYDDRADTVEYDDQGNINEYNAKI